MTHAYLAGEAQAERIRVAQVMSMRFRICKRRLKGKLANVGAKRPPKAVSLSGLLGVWGGAAEARKTNS